MSKLPSFQFYPGDWLKDPDLRVCSHFARGLLVDLLCTMFEAKHRGRLCKADGVTPWTNEQIVGLSSGGDVNEKLNALAELESNNVLKRDDHGVLFSARMVRDDEIRRSRAEAGATGGSKTQANRKQTDNQTTEQNSTPSSSSSSSSSSSEKERNTGSLSGTNQEKPIDAKLSEIDREYNQPRRDLGRRETFLVGRGGDPLVSQFADVYPKKTDFDLISHELYGAMTRLIQREGWTDQKAFEFILSKAREYANSKIVKTSNKKDLPSPARWLLAGRYLDDPSEWNVDGSPFAAKRPQKPKIRQIPNASTAIGDEMERLMT